MNIEDVIREVMQLTKHLLEEKAEPNDVAYALTAVATDMGLQMSDDSISVVPILLEAISARVLGRCKQSEEDEDDQRTEPNNTTQVPTGTTIH